MLKSWDAALKDYQAHTDDGQAIIAKAVGDTPADLKTAFDGVRFYSLAEQRPASDRRLHAPRPPRT